jgi:hypothetical protein
MTGKRRRQSEIKHPARSTANLGQKEAVLEKASDEQLTHMEGGKGAELARQHKAKATSRGERRQSRQH